jgi:hypothetical protein
MNVNKGLVEIGKNCHFLRVVDLYLAKGITDEAIVSIVNHNGHLRQLFLSQLRGISSASIRAIAENCSELESLYLNGCISIPKDALFEVIPPHSLVFPLTLLLSLHI